MIGPVDPAVTSFVVLSQEEKPLVQLGSLFLTSLAVFNYWIGRRALYPAFVFCAVWAADLALVWLVGDVFYPLSATTVLIFCSGGLFFSLGGALALLLPATSKDSAAFGASADRTLTLLTLILVCVAPVMIMRLMRLASNFDVPTLIGVRMATLAAEYSNDPWDSVFNNFLTLALIVSLLAFFYREHSRSRAVTAVVVTLVLSVMTANRANIVTLLFALICLDAIVSGRFRRRLLLGLLFLFVIICGGMAIFIRKGDARADLPIGENLVAVLHGFVLYGAGGLVAFDTVVRDPNIVPHNWQISRFFLQVAEKLGVDVIVPTLHAQFVDVGPNGLNQNVYTMYFAYIDLGYAGMMLVLAGVAFLVTLCYSRAVKGNAVSTVVYSFFFYGLLASPFNENFFMGLNFSIKLYASAWLLRHLPSTAPKTFVVPLSPQGRDNRHCGVVSDLH